MLAALGVIYGDIGTSPLYAFRICFSDFNGISINEANILGVLSLIFWSLILIISVKYMFIILKADNKGEGGVLVLMTLFRGKGPALAIITFFGLFGFALLFGDGLITPAISVLSAVEGLIVVTDVFKPFVVPIAVLILVILFSFQKRLARWARRLVLL
jgi:KUP system potassium uptake protein